MGIPVISVTKQEVLTLEASADIVRARQVARQWAQEQGFSLVDQTKILTAASELARNTIVHGRGGSMRLEVILDGPRRGLRLIFEDSGPGIPNIDLAMKDGYTTAGGLGMGLGGARRLSSEFDIQSAPGRGTRVTIVRWK